MSRPAQSLGRKKPSKPVKKSRTETTAYAVPDLNKEIVDIYEADDTKKRYTYKCCSCGYSTKDIGDKTFPDSYSNLYAGWVYHLPICKSCIDKLYEVYVQKQHLSVEDAVRRICMTFDIYYHPDLVDIMKKGSKPNKRMTFYISKASLKQYANKTYVNTILDEQAIAQKEAENQVVPDDEEVGIKERDYKFWGFGFSSEDIEFLNNKYTDWTTSHECSTHSQVVIFKQMCMLELQILKNMQTGQPTAPLQKQLNDFMNSGNLQPKQNNDNTFVETNTFGTLIKKWENERPISEPSPEWQDVDKIKHYISVWFLGHLCKMIGLNNKFGQKWTRLYDEEVERFTAHPPTYFDTDGEAPTFDDVFNK